MPNISPDRPGPAHSVSTYGHVDCGAPLSHWTHRTLFPGPEVWYRPPACPVVSHSRGTGEPEPAPGLASTISSSSPESRGADGLDKGGADEDGDELPSVTEIFSSQPVRSHPKLIDLTLDLSDEESTPPSPTLRPSASLSPHISATQRSTSSLSSTAVRETPTLEPGLCLPTLPLVQPTKHLSGWPTSTSHRPLVVKHPPAPFRTTPPSHGTGDGGGDTLDEDDDLPTIEEIFRARPGPLRPEFVNLTLDSSDEEWSTPPPTFHRSICSPALSIHAAPERRPSPTNQPSVLGEPDTIAPRGRRPTTPAPGIGGTWGSAAPRGNISVQEHTRLGISLVRRRRHSIPSASFGRPGSPYTRPTTESRMPWTPNGRHLNRSGQDGPSHAKSLWGTRKRKASPSERPALGAGVFAYDVFGEDDSDNGRRRRPSPYRARVAFRPPAVGNNLVAPSNGASVLHGARDKYVDLSVLPPYAMLSSLHIWIVSERQTNEGFEYEVIAGNGQETRTTWRHWADLDQELLQVLLKQFKVKQRTRRYKVRATSRKKHEATSRDDQQDAWRL